MPAATDRAEFAPPPQPGRARAFALAVFAHVLLMIALTWGITWNNDPQDMSAEAELWASVPKEAAPAALPPPAPVVQAPPLQPAPPPTPPEPKVEPPAPPVVPKEPDIAVQQEKRKQEEAERRRLELERQKLEARKREEALEREKKLEARKEEAERKKLEARKKQEEQEKRELAEQKAAAEKKRREEEAKVAKAKQEAERAAALRKDQIDRMQRLAQSGTGGPQSTGTAARSEGPSDSYAGRIRARVRPNIVFTDDVSGNPTAEVEVRMAPDGTITSKRVVKSSGVKAWDEAVIRALDKTEVLPRDVDGRVHSPLTILFRPKG